MRHFAINFTFFQRFGQGRYAYFFGSGTFPGMVENKYVGIIKSNVCGLVTQISKVSQTYFIFHRLKKHFEYLVNVFLFS